MKRMLVVALLLCSLCACERGAGDAAPAASAAASGARSTTAPAPVDEEPLESVDDEPDSADDEAGDADRESDPNASCAPKDPKLKPMQLLRFTFSDAIKGKDPGAKLRVARPGQRVYAHFRMRNRSGRKRCMHLTFRVAGKKRTEVTLVVGKSWSWRTWAYNTIKGDDRGPLTLEVNDDQGQLMLKKSLAIVPE
jgi:hypothetical protein